MYIKNKMKKFLLLYRIYNNIYKKIIIINYRLQKSSFHNIDRQKGRKRYFDDCLVTHKKKQSLKY